MTYQNIGYWIGQSNDTSTGRHPTGWTTGQRWLETAPEWMAMYDAENAAGHDTSTGTHPTGWVSGQPWSTTASQWKAMYDTLFAQRPPAGTGWMVTASRGNKGAVQVTLNKAGYWFAYVNGGLTSDVSGTHYEGNVYMDGAPSRQWRAHDGRCIMSTGWAAPVFASNGQVLNASFDVDSGDVGMDWPFTLYAVFVPTQAYPV